MGEEEQKAKILTELFNSRKVHHQVQKICFKNRIHPDTHIQEDILQVTFLHLSKTKAEKIINLHQQGEVNLLGYACLIAIRKGVLSDNKNLDYPKHSVAKHILFASNLNKFETIANEDIDDDDHSNFKHVLTAPIEGENIEQLLVLIKDNLNKNENIFLENLLHNKKRGRYKNLIKIRRDKLFEKIKIIVNEKKINING